MARIRAEDFMTLSLVCGTETGGLSNIKQVGEERQNDRRIEMMGSMYRERHLVLVSTVLVLSLIAGIIL